MGEDSDRLVSARPFGAGAGMFKIDINGKMQLTVDGKKPLLQTLADNNIFLPRQKAENSIIQLYRGCSEFQVISLARGATDCKSVGRCCAK